MSRSSYFDVVGSSMKNQNLHRPALSDMQENFIKSANMEHCFETFLRKEQRS